MRKTPSSAAFVVLLFLSVTFSSVHAQRFQTTDKGNPYDSSRTVIQTSQSTIFPGMYLRYQTWSVKDNQRTVINGEGFVVFYPAPNNRTEFIQELCREMSKAFQWPEEECLRHFDKLYGWLPSGLKYIDYLPILLSATDYSNLADFTRATEETAKAVRSVGSIPQLIVSLTELDKKGLSKPKFSLIYVIDKDNLSGEYILALFPEKKEFWPCYWHWPWHDVKPTVYSEYVVPTNLPEGEHLLPLEEMEWMYDASYLPSPSGKAGVFVVKGIDSISFQGATLHTKVVEYGISNDTRRWIVHQWYYDIQTGILVKQIWYMAYLGLPFADMSETTLIETNAAIEVSQPTKIATALTIELKPPSIAENTPATVTVSGKLVRKDSGAGLSGKVIQISSMTVTIGTATTTPDGSYSYEWKTTGLVSGQYTVTASFGGDVEYEASSDSKVLTVGMIRKGWERLQSNKYPFLEVRFHPGNVKLAELTLESAERSLEKMTEYFRLPSYKVPIYVTLDTSDPELPESLKPEKPTQLGKFSLSDGQVYVGSFAIDIVAHELAHAIQREYWGPIVYFIYNKIWKIEDVEEGVAEYIATDMVAPTTIPDYKLYYELIKYIVSETGGEKEIITKILEETSKIEWDMPNPGFKRATGKTYMEWKEEFGSNYQPEIGGTLLALQETGAKLYLHAYDSEGRHVGMNTEKGEIEIGIEDAEYYDFGKAIVITLPTRVSEFRYLIDASQAENSSEDYRVVIANGGKGLLSVEVRTGSIAKMSQLEHKVSIVDGNIRVEEARVTSLWTNYALWTVVGVLIIGVLISIGLKRRGANRFRRRT